MDKGSQSRWGDRLIYQKVMKTLLVLLLVALSSVLARGGWLPRDIHEVRAYVYDYTHEKDQVTLLKRDRLHKGVINAGGAKLSAEQVERLKNAIRSNKALVPGAFCYYPHHGFVFYDKAGKAMGHIELCFQCRNADFSPKGLPEREWNWAELRKLLEELKIPILQKDEEYTKLFAENAAEKE